MTARDDGPQSGRERGGARARRRERAAGAERQGDAGPSPFRGLRNPYRPIEVFSADQIEAIHDASMVMLEEIGLKVLWDEARALYKAAGAEVRDGEELVRFERGLVEELVAKAPPTIKLHSRNPIHDAEFGRDRVVFATVGGPPNVSDLERGRRPGSAEALADFVKLAQSFDVVHVIGAPAEPVDVPLNVRHLEIARIYLTLSEKVPFFYSRGPQALADAVEMARIVRGIEQARLLTEPSCYTVVNMNSPLQLDMPMSQGIIDMARLGQAVVVTPFTLAGAMAPITIAGALAQQNAEALAGIALSQIVRPGAPVVYGGFTSNVDMKSGAPAFGTPEYTQAALAGGQLARRYGLPYRSSNTTASNAPDAQAAYESEMSLWGALMGGCNFLLHGAGWLEGGLTSSYEKFILDVEMLRMMAAFFRPPVVDEASLGLDAVREVGPGGHYFGAAHTLERYENAFYAPLVSDWRNFETWEEDGAQDATARANRLWKETLARFEPPPMDPAVAEELEAFIARRTEEGGAEIA
jgi:trimethylamine--corrinoid protein Co-methyltransferase